MKPASFLVLLGYGIATVVTTILLLIPIKLVFGFPESKILQYALSFTVWLGSAWLVMRGARWLFYDRKLWK